MASNNMIQKFPITASEITKTHTMFDPNLAGTMGKTVHQKLDRAAMDYVAVPREFLKPNKFVTIVADVVLMKSVELLITIYHGIKVVTIEHMSTFTDKKLMKYLIRVMKIYP